VAHRKHARQNCILANRAAGGRIMSSMGLKMLAAIRARHPLRNTYQETITKLAMLDRVALWITQHVGTMGFFLLIAVWTFIWLTWKFISNMIQILLMPLIMVGQNLQGTQSEARAEHDLEVNIKAEQEIEVILHHLERQNDMLVAMLEKQGIKLDEVLRLEAAAT
jgi:uncharacterized membrane protein